MRKIFAIIIISNVLSLGCNMNNKRIEAHIQDELPQKEVIKNRLFHPDTSINDQLFLRNPLSITKVLGDIMPLMNDLDAAFPYLYLFSNTEEQYLKMIFYPGDVANTISQFEVGFTTSIPSNIEKKTSLLSDFYTESKIVLGMTKSEILEIKGVNYEEIMEEDILLIRYIIEDYDGSVFLGKYNMPVYLAEYWIKDDRLIKYRFGFEYP